MTVSSYSAMLPSLLTSLAYKQKTQLLIDDSALLILQPVFISLDASDPFLLSIFTQLQPSVFLNQAIKVSEVSVHCFLRPFVFIFLLSVCLITFPMRAPGHVVRL